MAMPLTPPYSPQALEPTILPADKNDPAFSPPHTPDQKAVEPTGEYSPVHMVASTDLTGIDALAGIPGIKPVMTATDQDIPDNYVSATIEKQKYLPPVTWSNLHKNIQWISFLALTVTPALAIYGIFTVPFNWKTATWA
jgi:stearoyl-CoA desaturase (delta-9 desaturase)